MTEKEVLIKDEFIRLDALMKLSDVVATGGHAKIVIQNGEVKVNGETCTMRGKKMREGDFFTFEGLKVTVKQCL